MDALDRQRPARRRGRLRPALVLALVLAATPAVARAQGPLGPLPAQPVTAPTVATPPPTTATTASSTSSGGLSSNEQVALFGAGIVLIAGIAFLIRRDARARTPAGRPASDAPRATVRPRAKRVEQSRARAKAARAQRKRQRTRR
ncbi:MAG TPA: hypothetical protein VFR49_00975 [Solirubrobacteraceae bacterium]|nr:hypothetical protein [Solirubrobacteraceae bacterium]